MGGMTVELTDPMKIQQYWKDAYGREKINVSAMKKYQAAKFYSDNKFTNGFKTPATSKQKYVPVSLIQSLSDGRNSR